MSSIDPQRLQPQLPIGGVTGPSPDAAPTTNASNPAAPSFDALLESLDRLRKTNESSALEDLDSGLRAADALQQQTRELGARLEAAFRKHVGS